MMAQVTPESREWDEQKFESENCCDSKLLIIEDRSWEVPTIEMPFEIQPPHPATVGVAEKIHKWLQQRGVDVALGTQVWDKFVAAHTADLCSQIYVNADDEMYEWVCKWVSLTFTLDDAIDDPDTETFKDPGKILSLVLELQMIFLMAFPRDVELRRQLQRFIDLLPDGRRESVVKYVEDELAKARADGTGFKPWEEKVGPLAAVLRELWGEAMEAGPPESNLRLAHLFQQWIISTFVETKNRRTATVPSLAKYIKLRQDTGCTQPYLCIIDLVYRSPTPNSVYYSPEMQKMLEATGDYVAWNNDIYSVSKEVLGIGDFHNMVYLISREQNCSLKEAAIISMRMMLDKLAEIEQAAADLRRIAPAECQQAVELHINICKNWCSGTNEWHRQSKRYKA